MTQGALVDTLRRVLATHPDSALCVAFSGGPDSSALLHALATLPQARARGLRAMHVDHGLHPGSTEWATHCEQFCKRIDIALDVHRVTVETHSGTGLEAAARKARYGIFTAALRAGESLLTAHHRDDQVETVLLKLLRGAGPEGLGGMRERRPFSGGWLWRPLLDTPRAVLAAYLREHGIESIDDPSNQSRRHARNVLRLDILPRLVERWPQALDSITHSARLNRDAADYIQSCSAEVLADLQRDDGASLDAHAWLNLHPALRGPVLATWLHARGLPAPSLAQRAQLLHQVATAAADCVPLVRWPGAAVHFWRGRLHAHPPLLAVPDHWTHAWAGSDLPLPAAAGTLRLVATGAATGEPVPALEVRLGETGIRMRPAGDPHTRELRDLFQQRGIPPWWRRRCPIIYDADGTLLAVADLWQTRAGKRLFDACGRYPRWQPRGTA